MIQRCSVCGKPEISKEWTFKSTSYCSFRCFAKGSIKVLIFYSIIFSLIFIPSMIALAFSDIPIGIIVPFIIAELLGPLPGFVIGLLGLFYKRKDKKNNLVPYIDAVEENGSLKLSNEQKEEEKQIVCKLCSSAITQTDHVLQIDSCNHIFHKDCLLTWIKDKETCPICGEKIEKIIVQ